MAEVLRTRGQVPRRDANLAAGLAVGGFYGLVTGKSGRAAAAGTLTGGLLVLSSTILGERMRQWASRRAEKKEEKREKEAQGVVENPLTKWVPRLPKWFPLQIRDATQPYEMTEAEKARILLHISFIHSFFFLSFNQLTFFSFLTSPQMDKEIYRLELEIKRREAKLREEDDKEKAGRRPA